MRAAVGVAGVIGALLLASLADAQPRQYVVTVDPAHASAGFDKISVSRAAIGTAEVRLWANAAIDPDCSVSSAGQATLSVVTPPQHGTLRLSDEPFYLAYPPANPRSACNDRKIPGHQAFYTAAGGFTGRDRAVLQGSSPDGRVRQITVDIRVR